MQARSDRFQEWQALTDNRRTRQRLRRFLIQGVRPISVAMEWAWPLDALLFRPGPLSPWAAGLLAGDTPAQRVQLPVELLHELGGRDGGAPEVVAVGVVPEDDLDRIPADADLLLVADRTASPGNLGTMIRSADALGVGGMVVVGHAADLYDPQAVRASRGSLFALPVVRVESPSAVLDWLDARPVRCCVVGADEAAADPAWTHDWRTPTVLVVGNEAGGLSRAWSSVCDRLVAIPQTGAASSLNVAVSASILLYEAHRQRSAADAGTLGS